MKKTAIFMTLAMVAMSATAQLKVESEKEVTLKNDKVQEQGTLKVTADTLILKEGFEVTKGSTFEFHNR